MGSRLRQWLADESGHDLVEYMLLTTFIAIVGYLGMQAIGIEMNTTYRIWDASTQNAWEPSPPTP